MTQKFWRTFFFKLRYKNNLLHFFNLDIIKRFTNTKMFKQKVLFTTKGCIMSFQPILDFAFIITVFYYVWLTVWVFDFLEDLSTVNLPIVFYFKIYFLYVYKCICCSARHIFIFKNSDASS